LQDRIKTNSLIIFHLYLNLKHYFVYLDNSISSSVQAIAVCADCFSEGDLVVLYKSSICSHVEVSFVIWTPTQKAASLISEGILYKYAGIYFHFYYSYRKLICIKQYYNITVTDILFFEIDLYYASQSPHNTIELVLITFLRVAIWYSNQTPIVCTSHYSIHTPIRRMHSS